MTHQFRLKTAPFRAIKSGQKTIESRLFDKKRQAVQLGDIIEFTNYDDQSEKVRVKVIGLLRYTDFHDMFSHHDYHKFGGESVKQLSDQINEFYSIEAQDKFGVIGIEFEKL